jgi:E3 ubiquitin-protein ligase TRIP12
MLNPLLFSSDDDIDDSLAAVVISQGATRHKLQFIMNDQVLPYNMTVYQAIRQYGGSGMDPGGDLDSDFIDPATSVLGSSGIWSQTHTIYYRPVSEDGVSAALPQSVPAKSTSKKNKSPSSKSSKSKKDPLWHGKFLVSIFDLLFRSFVP